MFFSLIFKTVMEDDYTNSTHYKSDIMLHHVVMMNVYCYAFSICSDCS